jgi:hypothetical protein
MAEEFREVTVTRRVRLVEHWCPACGRKFKGGPLKVYCLPSCAQRAAYQRHAEQRRAERRERYRQQKGPARAD